METVRGTIAKIRFHEANFAIVVLAGGATVKGPLIEPQLGLEYEFRGAWVDDVKFGRQFQLESYEVHLPTSVSGVRRYLDENCPGVGPAIARRLVDAYGENALSVCKAEPERVAAEIHGVTLARAQDIAAALRKNEESAQMILALHELIGQTKVSKRAIGRIIERWQKSAAAVIQSNPYVLTEIDGIGFLTADEVARRLNADMSAPARIKAGILHVLAEESFGSGHVFLPTQTLRILASKLLQVDGDLVTAQVAELAAAGEHVVVTEESVYLRRLYDAETAIAAKLRVLMQSRPKVHATVETAGLQEDQVEAVKAAAESPVFVLTGAPGTGKSFTIRRLIDSFSSGTVALCAPTGKAAKRMIELTGRDALTIHKLLEPEPLPAGGFAFQRNAGYPLDADVVVADEVSMVDVTLMASLLSAIAPGTRLILVGDMYQLPSVGPGNVLAEILGSGLVPSVELDKIKRQDAGDIITNCHRIKGGLDIVVQNQQSRDFFFLDVDDEAAIVPTLVEAVTRRLKERYQADPRRDMQVISPLREKTMLGCKALNDALRQAILGIETPDGPVKFVVGDKVIQAKNQYDLGVINGDIGYVNEIDEKGRAKAWVIDFENPARRVVVPMKDHNLELAYCITGHKMQGSEARIVLIPAHPCFGAQIWQRNWIYTAISRAKEVCVLVGQRRAVSGAINRNNVVKRFTRLGELLRSKDL